MWCMTRIRIGQSTGTRSNSPCRCCRHNLASKFPSGFTSTRTCGFWPDRSRYVSVFYGAAAACILPVLYALLGTCAFLLRCFSQQMSSRTFVPSRSDSPRFLIAAIGGAVVGFFHRFALGQDTSISPFAIAFLVGYAVDIFFSFLDGLVQAFTKSKTNNTAQTKEA